VWECSKCHEQHEDSFDICWNCGTDRDGTENTSFRRADDEPPTGIAKESLHPEADNPFALKNCPSWALICPKCGSREVIPDARIMARGYNLEIQVEVYESPNALIFKGTHARTLRASICGQCGHAELYVRKPAGLLVAYKKSREA
jgi:hypothetical protein